MSKIVITIDEPFNQVNCCNCAKVLIIREDGKKRSRIVTMESLLKAMKGSTVLPRVNITVGKIPFGYYDAQLSEEQGKFSARMIAVLPAGKQMMRYEDTLYDVSMPSLVFRFEVVRERIISTEVFAMRDEAPTDKSYLFRYPLGNVSKEGRVCWGRNKLPDIHSLKELEEAMILFIQSPCNSDYFTGTEYCGHKGITLRELFEKLKDEKVYPDDYLVALKNGRKRMTLGDLVTWRCVKNKRRTA